MKRTYCDACQVQIQERSHEFTPLIHICETGEGRLGGYADRHFNAISGRSVHFDLCTRCYNQVMGAAYAEMKSIQRTVKDDDRSE